MKLPNSLVPYSNKDAALLAVKYAREFIVEGSTQLINNSYLIDKKKSLSEAAKAIREKSQEMASSRLEFDYYAYEFYQSIECSKKYSIGNCNELAELALDYIAHYAPHIHAEVFQLLGGNHVVLVVGRQKIATRENQRRGVRMPIFAILGLMMYILPLNTFPALKITIRDMMRFQRLILIR
ncbi:hypothetical protein [Legionella cardiaca]|uniref:Uncharacterized protein n=1 Tax=Legionella cardiaca TaxID=1071983 RepID=A0ABY8APC0_9GAMM|nr:hypothetical protein [Legionella cardiaca]WED42373.1 hypothetical protein PXX05_10635 [Legionella cardiaca]